MASSTDDEVRLLENGLLDASPIESTKNITQRNWEESPFLFLPAEIRNRIYAYVLKTKPIIRINGYGTGPVYMSTHDYHMQFRSSRHKLPKFYCLQQVCRAIYAETALLPYFLNSFQFELERLKHDSQCLLPTQVEAIRSVFCTTDRWRTPDIHPCLPGLEVLKGLQKMIWCPTVGPWKHSSEIEAQKGYSGGKTEVLYFWRSQSYHMVVDHDSTQQVHRRSAEKRLTCKSRSARVLSVMILDHIEASPW